MAEQIFWGANGEYGPFTTQQDGWPNAGEVLRYYRRQKKLQAEEVAKRYSELIGEQVTARWILKMEQQNKVPTDITRRRALVQILEIPPILLGLASLGQATYEKTPNTNKSSVPTLLKSAPTIDISTYEDYAQMRWLLSYTGEDSLDEIVLNIRKLEQLERQNQGNLQRHTREVLNSYYQLASDIARHQGNFALAWKYANDALRITELIGLRDFISAAFYRRGYTNLEWGIFGDRVSHGLVNSKPERKKIEAAIIDFEAALPSARPQLKGAIWLELSRAQAILQHHSFAMHLFQQAEGMIGATTTASSPIEQILLEGALNGLSEGMYLLGKTASLIVLGRTTTAIEVLDELDELKNGKGIPRNQTRRLAYANTLRAEASFGVKDYMTASIRAIEAFQTFEDINTIERIAGINALHRRLTERYGKQPEVKELGKMLSSYYKRTAPHEKL